MQRDHNQTTGRRTTKRLRFTPLIFAVLFGFAGEVCASAPTAQETTPGNGVAPSTAAVERPPAGRWAGTLVKAKLDLEVTLRWEGEMLMGTVDIPAQGLERGRLVDCSFEDGELRFRLDGIPGEPEFRGAFDEAVSRFAGNFTQSGANLRLELARVVPASLHAAIVLDGFDEWVADQLKRLRVPGMAIAVVWQGEVVLARGFGLADIQTKAPVTGDTLFAIGSTSKAFTTFALAQAVEEGLLDWDTPVRKWLPHLTLEDEGASAQLTLRDMCSHRSGLPRHDLVWYANPAVTRAELVERLAFLEPTEGFRAKWQYNNLMFAAAGLALENATGSTWETRVRERILEPLGMRRTTFGLAETEAATDVARPHDRKGLKDFVLPFHDLTAIGPAGSIHSSANDMARWLGLLLGRGEASGQRLLERGGFQALVSAVSVIDGDGAPTAYGLGWMLDAREGHFRFHHGGGIDGFTTQVEVYPTERLGIFVATNRASVLTNLAATQLAERFLELEVADTASLAATQMEAREKIGADLQKSRAVDRIGDAPHARPLAAYAARYWHAGYGDLEVTLDGEALRVRYGAYDVPLEHWHFETFRCGEAQGADILEGLLVQFRDDAAGLVTSVELQLELMVAPIRFSRQPDRGLADRAYRERCVGDYMLYGQSILVASTDTALTLHITGQPIYSLRPATHGRFTLDVADGFWVRFELPEAGPATGLVLTQPNGTLRAERRE